MERQKFFCRFDVSMMRVVQFDGLIVLLGGDHLVKKHLVYLTCFAHSECASIYLFWVQDTHLF